MEQKEKQIKQKRISVKKEQEKLEEKEKEITKKENDIKAITRINELAVQKNTELLQANKSLKEEIVRTGKSDSAQAKIFRRERA